jgi:hypothetical protein
MYPSQRLPFPLDDASENKQQLFDIHICNALKAMPRLRLCMA